SHRTEIARAPAVSYVFASEAGSSDGARSPLDGDRRLISAMSEVPGAASAPRKSRTGGAADASGRDRFSSSTAARRDATIFSRKLTIGATPTRTGDVRVRRSHVRRR